MAGLVPAICFWGSARQSQTAPRLLPKRCIAVLGLATKSGALESKDTTKRRIDAAAKHADLDQLSLSPQWLRLDRGRQARRLADLTPAELRGIGRRYQIAITSLIELQFRAWARNA
jgi:hypothetical protein